MSGGASGVLPGTVAPPRALWRSEVRLRLVVWPPVLQGGWFPQWPVCSSPDDHPITKGGGPGLPPSPRGGPFPLTLPPLHPSLRTPRPSLQFTHRWAEAVPDAIGRPPRSMLANVPPPCLTCVQFPVTPLSPISCDPGRRLVKGGMSAPPTRGLSLSVGNWYMVYGPWEVKGGSFYFFEAPPFQRRQETPREVPSCGHPLRAAGEDF